MKKTFVSTRQRHELNPKEIFDLLSELQSNLEREVERRNNSNPSGLYPRAWINESVKYNENVTFAEVKTYDNIGELFGKVLGIYTDKYTCDSKVALQKYELARIVFSEKGKSVRGEIYPSNNLTINPRVIENMFQKYSNSS